MSSIYDITVADDIDNSTCPQQHIQEMLSVLQSFDYSALILFRHHLRQHIVSNVKLVEVTNVRFFHRSHVLCFIVINKTRFIYRLKRDLLLNLTLNDLVF